MTVVFLARMYTTLLHYYCTAVHYDSSSGVLFIFWKKCGVCVCVCLCGDVNYEIYIAARSTSLGPLYAITTTCYDDHRPLQAYIYMNVFSKNKKLYQVR